MQRAFDGECLGQGQFVRDFGVDPGLRSRLGRSAVNNAVFRCAGGVSAMSRYLTLGCGLMSRMTRTAAAVS